MVTRILALALAAALSVSTAFAQIRIGLMVSATNHNGMDERAPVLVTIRGGKLRLLPE
jgi:hypothetical protein